MPNTEKCRVDQALQPLKQKQIFCVLAGPGSASVEKKITHMVLSDNILAEWCGVTYRPVKSQAKCALYRLKYIFFKYMYEL